MHLLLSRIANLPFLRPDSLSFFKCSILNAPRSQMRTACIRKFRMEQNECLASCIHETRLAVLSYFSVPPRKNMASATARMRAWTSPLRQSDRWRRGRSRHCVIRHGWDTARKATVAFHFANRAPRPDRVQQCPPTDSAAVQGQLPRKVHSCRDASALRYNTFC